MGEQEGVETYTTVIAREARSNERCHLESREERAWTPITERVDRVA